MPSISSVHIDAPLSNVSVQYKNEELVAERVLPLVSVNKRSDLYFIYNKPDHFTPIDALTAHNAEVGEISYSVSTGSYTVKDYALKDFVSEDLIRNADAPLAPLIDATENLTARLAVDHEIKLAASLFSTSVITNNVTVSTKWTNASADPIGELLTGIDAIVGVPGPFCVLFGEDAWRTFRQHPDVLAAFQMVQGGAVATEDQVKSFFGLEDVIIGKGWKNTANQGATASYSRIWGDSVLIFKRSRGLNVKEVGLGLTLQFNQRQVTRWRDDSLGVSGGEYVKVGWSYADELMATDAAYLIDNTN